MQAANSLAKQRDDVVHVMPFTRPHTQRFGGVVKLLDFV